MDRTHIGRFLCLFLNSSGCIILKAMNRSYKAYLLIAQAEAQRANEMKSQDGRMRWECRGDFEITWSACVKTLIHEYRSKWIRADLANE